MEVCYQARQIQWLLLQHEDKLLNNMHFFSDRRICLGPLANLACLVRADAQRNKGANILPFDSMLLVSEIVLCDILTAGRGLGPHGGELIHKALENRLCSLLPILQTCFLMVFVLPPQVELSLCKVTRRSCLVAVVAVDPEQLPRLLCNIFLGLPRGFQGHWRADIRYAQMLTLFPLRHPCLRISWTEPQPTSSKESESTDRRLRILAFRF
mmetsp:Transcript_53169/g.172938  ORF Transcript_53169/g.172938 Transcript_53169/m.172938 type:complete len:211 (-) Transcript_53169:2788-3420(-)